MTYCFLDISLDAICYRQHVLSSWPYVLGKKSKPLDHEDVPLFYHFKAGTKEAQNCFPWTGAKLNCSWTFGVKKGDILICQTSQRMPRWEGKKQTSRNDCKKKKRKKELQTGGNVFKTQMNSTMLINLTTGLFHMA